LIDHGSQPKVCSTDTNSDKSKAQAGGSSVESVKTIDVDNVEMTNLPTRTELREEWLQKRKSRSKKSPCPSIRVGGPPNTPSKIVYFDFQGRAAPIMHVLAAAKHKYGHEQFELSSSAIAGETYTSVLTKHLNNKALKFAPPLLIEKNDGGKQLKISQVPAILIYLGEKYHMLPSEPEDQILARQYICDQQDLFNACVAPVLTPEADQKPRATSAAYKRMVEFCDLIERQIKGPFYFGAKATYVDYALVGVIETIKALHRQTFKGYKNTPIRRKMTKISRSLKDELYYKKVKSIPVWPDALVISKEVAKAAVKLDQPSPVKRQPSLKRQESGKKDGSKKKKRMRKHSSARKNFKAEKSVRTPAKRSKMKVPRLQKPPRGVKEKTGGTTTTDPATHPMKSSHSKKVERRMKRRQTTSIPVASWKLAHSPKPRPK